MRRLLLTIAACAALGGCALNPPELGPATVSLPPRAELAHVAFFAQEQYQCGPAALASALRSAGAAATPAELVAEVYLPGKQGSLQVELIAAARRRDRLAYALPGELSAALAQVAAGTPVVVMQNLGLKIAPMWHFAVLVGYDLHSRTLILRSGTTQRRVVGMRGFMRTWDRAGRWALVVLEPHRLPASAELDRYVAAAASLEAVGRLDAAAQAYRQARQRWPDSIWPLLGLANIHYRKGDGPAAAQGYEAVLSLDPGNIVAHNNLAEILIERHCLGKARAHVERATELAGGTSLEVAVAATAQKLSGAKLSNAHAECAAE